VPFVVTYSANGKTLTTQSESYAVVTYFDANGDVARVTVSGPVFLFTAPGVGTVAIDVGHLVFENDEVVFEAGPHQLLENSDVDALCAYLADP
jgi:hypothetical protein